MVKLTEIVVASIISFVVFIGMVRADESCNCIIALTSVSGFQNENQMYNVVFKDSNNNCDSGSSERCLSKCQTGFLRSTGGGDLSHKSRRSPKMIGELLCIEYNKDVSQREVGLYYKSCDEQQVLDTNTRASRNICCSSGQFSHC